MENIMFSESVYCPCVMDFNLHYSEYLWQSFWPSIFPHPSSETFNSPSIHFHTVYRVIIYTIQIKKSPELSQWELAGKYC